MITKFNINELNNYMFHNNNVIKFNKNILYYNHKYVKNIPKKNINNLENNKFFKPDEKDKLFWCFYNIINNFNNYLLNKNNLFKIEKQFKIDAISKIRNFKLDLKKYKIKINDIEHELINNNIITLNIINVLSIIYKISIIIIHNNIYFFFNYGNDHIHIIEKINNDYVLHLEKNNKNIINDIFNNKLLVDYKKPIKSISSYKLIDLQNICKKLNIKILNENSKKKTKKNLYEEILNKIEN